MAKATPVGLLTYDNSRCKHLNQKSVWSVFMYADLPRIPFPLCLQPTRVLAVYSIFSQSTVKSIRMKIVCTFLLSSTRFAQRRKYSKTYRNTLILPSSNYITFPTRWNGLEYRHHCCTSIITCRVSCVYSLYYILYVIHQAKVIRCWRARIRTSLRCPLRSVTAERTNIR